MLSNRCEYEGISVELKKAALSRSMPDLSLEQCLRQAGLFKFLWPSYTLLLGAVLEAAM